MKKTIQIPWEILTDLQRFRLARLAKIKHRSVAELVREAIELYVLAQRRKEGLKVASP